MNSIISWVGGKKALRDLIYLRMPKNYDRYIEVFGGGGWVLFGKPPDKCMEVYNDFNSNLANLFYCVKERPMALLRELSFLPLNSRDEFTTLRKFLTMEEFNEIKRHPEVSYHILKSADVYTRLAEHVLSHHERWDGTGYPRGLSGQEIPLASRIIAVAEAYEAMTGDRTYRDISSHEQAMEELKRCSGTQFDPEIIQTAERVLLH